MIKKLSLLLLVSTIFFSTKANANESNINIILNMNANVVKVIHIYQAYQDIKMYVV